MPRLMSVAFTEQAVRRREKIVTRRAGWWLDRRGRRILRTGDRITLCRKVMGRRPGEPLERICDVEIVSVRREPLNQAGRGRELELEGCGQMTFTEFAAAYFNPQGIAAGDLVTRIQWRYLDEPEV